MKLLREYLITDEFETIVEQKNPNEPKKIRTRGPYIVTEVENANKRVYRQKLMEGCVDHFMKTMVNLGRACGELNHPDSVEINFLKACHKITNLTQDKSVWIGESTILTGTPNGDIAAALLSHGVKMGMSTRGVGTISEGGIIDKEFKLITVDMVSEPSGKGCFVDAIMESKEFMINSHGEIVEMAYSKLKQGLDSVVRPSEHDDRVVKVLREFLRSI